MHFQLTGYRSSDGVFTADVEARDAEDARASAAADGIQILALRRHWRSWFVVRWRNASGFDVLLFCQELHALLDAGLSLTEALAALERQHAGGSNRQRLPGLLVARLRQGQLLSAALRDCADSFPPLLVALVAASERTGDLPHALGRFVAYRSQAEALSKRVRTAMIYPAILLGVGGLVIVFLLTYVVPRFARLYEDLGGDLPFASRVLVQWGALVRDHGTALAVAIVIIVVGATLWLRRSGTRSALRRRVLALPALRERFAIYEVSRFYRALGMLQRAGIAIVPAMGLAGEVLSPASREALERSVVAIRGGAAPSTALESQGLAPPVAGDLLRVGERTGSLGEKMLRIADFYDDESARWIERFSRAFEPALMLAIGIVVATVVVFLYLPIFELAGSLQ